MDEGHAAGLVVGHLWDVPSGRSWTVASVVGCQIRTYPLCVLTVVPRGVYLCKAVKLFKLMYVRMRLGCSALVLARSSVRSAAAPALVLVGKELIDMSQHLCHNTSTAHV